MNMNRVTKLISFLALTILPAAFFSAYLPSTKAQGRGEKTTAEGTSNQSGRPTETQKTQEVEYFGLSQGGTLARHSCVLRFTQVNARGEKEGIPYCWTSHKTPPLLGHSYDALPGEDVFKYSFLENGMRAKFIHRVRRMGDGGVTKIVTAERITCFLKRREIWCAGYAGKGHIRVETSSAHLFRYTRTPVRLEKLGTGLIDISLSRNSACAIKGKGDEAKLADGRETGELWCWGDVTTGSVPGEEFAPAQKERNDNWQAYKKWREDKHNGTTTEGYQSTSNHFTQTLPKLASPEILHSGILQVAVGDNFGCVVKYNPAHTGDEVYCWGDAHYGSLGNGETLSREEFLGGKRLIRGTPQKVIGLPEGKKIKKILARGSRACLQIEKSLWCWGGSTVLYGYQRDFYPQFENLVEEINRTKTDKSGRFHPIAHEYAFYRGQIKNFSLSGEPRWIIEPGIMPIHNQRNATKNEFSEFNQISEVLWGAGLCFIQNGQLYCKGLDSKEVGDGGKCDQLPRQKNIDGYEISACRTEVYRSVFWDQVPEAERDNILKALVQERIIR